MSAATTLQPLDRACLWGAGLSLAACLVIGLNVHVMRTEREAQGSVELSAAYAPPRPVVLWKEAAPACRRDDWLCEVDQKVLSRGMAFDKRRRVVEARR